MTTKVPAELSSTQSITDAGTASIDISGSSDPIFKMQGSGHPQLRLKTTGTTDNTSVDFGDSDSETVGRLLYNHANNYLQIQTGSSTRVRVDSDGLKFGSDTAAANALDDYEEGTYTPIMNSSNLTYSYQAGWYVKIGRHVTVGIHLDINTNGNGSGVAIGDISLPFTPSLGGAAYYSMTSSIWCNGWSTATKSDVGLITHDYGYIVTRKSAGQANVATPTHGDLGGGNILMAVSYQTA